MLRISTASSSELVTSLSNCMACTGTNQMHRHDASSANWHQNVQSQHEVKACRLWAIHAVETRLFAGDDGNVLKISCAEGGASGDRRGKRW